VCNNYAMFTTTEAMMRLRMEWERAMRNVPPLHVYPDYFAPIVRELDSRRVISLARWGLPSLKDPATEKPNKGTTNIRPPWFDEWKGYPAERRLGQAAKRRMQQLLATPGVQIIDSGERDRTRSRRPLVCKLSDGRSAGSVLIAEGLAREWTPNYRADWC
jgi:hypothetical protein